MLAILLLLYWQPLWPGFDTPLYGNILMVIAAILTLWSMVLLPANGWRAVARRKNCNEVLTKKTCL